MKIKSCLICGNKVEKETKTCSKECRKCLMILSKTKECRVFLRDLSFFLKRYDVIESLKRYEYCSHFNSFFNNIKICKVCNYDEYIKVLENILNMKVNVKEYSSLVSPNEKSKWISLGFSQYTSIKIAELFSTSKKGFILRYDNNDKAKNLYKEWTEKCGCFDVPPEQCYFSPKYWIYRGYSKEESTQKCKDINVRDKDFFTKKYGKEDGNFRYNEMRRKRSYSSSKKGYIQKHGERAYKELSYKKALNLDFFMRKYDEDLAIIKHKEFHSNRLKQIRKSKPTQKIKEFLDEKYSQVEEEFMIGGRAFDFKILEKVLIEVNGDWWHMNPLIYGKNFWNSVLEIRAEDLWNLDKNKLKKANIEGFSVIVIWEKSINSISFKEATKEIEKATLKIEKSNKIINFYINYIDKIVLETEVFI